MANRKFFVDIDLGGNKILQVLLEGLATDPAAKAKGRIYYNTTDNKIKYYNGTAWQALTDQVELAALATAMATDVSGIKTRLTTLEENGTHISAQMSNLHQKVTVLEMTQGKFTSEFSKIPARIDSRVKAGLGCSYDSSDKTIKLKYTDSAGAETVLGNIDASIFVRDSMVKDVALVVNPGQGLDGTTYPAGTYILFTFNVPNADGEKYIYLNVTSLIDVYTAGNGISVSGKVIAVKVATDSTEYITVSSAGLSVKKLYDKVSGWNSARVDEINELKTKADGALRTYKVSATSGNTKIIDLGTIPEAEGKSVHIRDVACFLGKQKVECAVALGSATDSTATVSWNGTVSTSSPLVIYVFYDLNN